MDTNVLDCDAVEFERGLCVCKGGPSLGILKDVQRAYEERIELIKRTGGRNKMQKELELLRSWVGDLVEQNSLLSRAVEEMEADISTRVLFERRRNTEIESELREEVAKLRRRLARKDSDLRGLLELLRRLRDYDHRDIGDIRFYEITEHDIFGCPAQSDLDCDDKPCERRTSNQKKSICDKVNDLKVRIDLLHKENLTKEREIQKLSKDVQRRDEKIACLKNEVSSSRNVSTKDEEVMTEVCSARNECGELVPVEEFSTRKETAEYQERMHQLEVKLKSSNESNRAMRKENVDLQVEIRAMGQLFAALDEQLHTAKLRLQFKDEIIREMRRQLRQAKAKAKAEVTVLNKPAQKAMLGEMDNNSTMMYDPMVACVRKQPRRKSRMRTEMDIMNIEWECRSPSDESADDTGSIKVE